MLDIETDIFSKRWWNWLYGEMAAGNKPLERYIKVSRDVERVACDHQKGGKEGEIPKLNQVNMVNLPEFTMKAGKCSECGLVYYYSERGVDLEDKVKETLAKIGNIVNKEKEEE